MKNLTKTIIFMYLVLTLTACGGGSGGGDGGNSGGEIPPTEENNNWGTMKWGQDNWG